MGCGRRVFLVMDEERLKRLSVGRFDRLHLDSAIEAMPELARRRVWYIQVFLDTAERRPTTVRSVECGILVFDGAGHLDRKARDEQMRLAAQMIDLGSPGSKPGSLIEARHLFARREYASKYKWTPSEAVLRAVSEAIFGF